MTPIASRRLVLKDPAMVDRPEENPNPLVSVVIPTYNRAQYIAETIESVLQQTYDNLEVIVIDDGSTDNTAEVVEPFRDRVRYVRQVNSERGASRNHGLRLASGQYIAFLDSDDLWLSGKVEEGVKLLEDRPSVGLVYTDSVQVNSDGGELRIVRLEGPSGRVTGKLLQKNFVSIGAHLARTSAIRDVGGFREERELSGSEDWEMWVRLSLITDFAYLPSATTKVRIHPSNTMGDMAAMHRSMSKAIALFQQSEDLTRFRTELKRAKANVALVNAINHCSNAKRTETIDFLRQAFSADPKIILDWRFAYTIVRLLKAK